MATNNNNKWLLIFFSAVVLSAFFLPWVHWADTAIAGYQMPLGDFFGISDKKFGLANPFPQFNAATAVFWIIPVLAVGIILLALANKKTGWLAGLTGFLLLSLAALYILFTNTLVDLGVGKSLTGSLNIGIYTTVIAATGIIIAGVPGKLFLKKSGLIITGPLLTWVGFYLGSNYVEKEEYKETDKVKQAYTVNALDLIHEFKLNDSLANTKYREKILLVNGRASAVNKDDSTVTVKMEDTTGSYAIFSFSDQSITDAQKIKEGDSLSVKASCSGGIYSNILETEVITFKRCTINKK